MWNATEKGRPMATQESTGRKYLLWVDGVGVYLLCLGQRVSFGGPAFDENAADVSLLADLSRRHATIVRCGEGYLLEAHANVHVAGRAVSQQVHLNDGYEIRLGDDVEMKFQLPTALSTSARIEFQSDHRPTLSVDGLVLMDDTCLLGASPENHVVCPECPGSVLLIRKGTELWCKSRMEVFVGRERVTQERRIESGDIVTGPELRFRLEEV